MHVCFHGMRLFIWWRCGTLEAFLHQTLNARYAHQYALVACMYKNTFLWRISSVLYIISLEIIGNNVCSQSLKIPSLLSINLGLFQWLNQAPGSSYTPIFVIWMLWHCDVMEEEVETWPHNNMASTNSLDMPRYVTRHVQVVLVLTAM